MRDTSWTPGPWEVDFENCHTGQVATCHGDGDGYYEVWSRSWMEHGIDQKANAHLIAAAPELYEALELLVRCIDETRGRNASDALHAAQTALAKARGEQS